MCARLLTAGEIAHGDTRRYAARHYAGRFAAQEALIKALRPESTDGATWHEAEVRLGARGSRSFHGARLPERIADMLTTESGPGGVAMSQTPNQQRAQMLALVLERDLEVTGTLGHEKVEVTTGGVPLAEVKASTLESRVVPGLHLCGEVLDVEGRLGGFNFQWAWSSGTVAGRGAARRFSATTS